MLYRGTIKPGLFYFAIVFAVGFGLGIVRVLWLVPRLGKRWAELLEMPLMFLAILLAAKWVTQRFSVPFALFERIVIGMVALSLMVCLEFTLVLWLQGLTLREYIGNRDPVSGIAYVIMLGVFGLLPCLVNRR